MYSQSKRSVSTLMATKPKVLMTAPTAFIISTKNHPTDNHQREQPARNKEKSWSCGRCGPDCKPVAWNRSQSGVRSNQTFVVLSLCCRSGKVGTRRRPIWVFSCFRIAYRVWKGWTRQLSTAKATVGERGRSSASTRRKKCIRFFSILSFCYRF